MVYAFDELWPFFSLARPRQLWLSSIECRRIPANGIIHCVSTNSKICLDTRYARIEKLTFCNTGLFSSTCLSPILQPSMLNRKDTRPEATKNAQKQDGEIKIVIASHSKEKVNENKPHKWGPLGYWLQVALQRLTPNSFCNINDPRAHSRSSEKTIASSSCNYKW